MRKPPLAPTRVPAQPPLEPEHKLPDRPGAASEASPLDVWWRLEDLWRRLATHCELRVDPGDDHRLILAALRHARGGELCELRAAVFDDASYHWQVGEHWGSLVELIDYQGDDLTLTLTSATRMRGWPDGKELASLVQGFVAEQRQKSLGSARVGT